MRSRKTICKWHLGKHSFARSPISIPKNLVAFQNLPCHISILKVLAEPWLEVLVVLYPPCVAADALNSSTGVRLPGLPNLSPNSSTHFSSPCACCRLLSTRHAGTLYPTMAPSVNRITVGRSLDFIRRNLLLSRFDFIHLGILWQFCPGSYFRSESFAVTCHTKYCGSPHNSPR